MLVISKFLFSLILVICVESYRSLDLKEYGKRNRKIAALAPAIEELIRSKYSDGRKWKEEVTKQIQRNDKPAQNLKLVSMKEFKTKLSEMAKWLNQVGVNRIGNIVLTQKLSQSLYNGILRMESGDWILANINPTYTLDAHGTLDRAQLRIYLREIIPRGGRKLFLIDDVSYTGIHIAAMLNRLDRTLGIPSKMLTVCLAVPFMSKSAKEYIQAQNPGFKLIFYPMSEEIPKDPLYDDYLLAFQHQSPNFVALPPWLATALLAATKKLYGTVLTPYSYHSVVRKTKRLRNTHKMHLPVKQSWRRSKKQ